MIVCFFLSLHVFDCEMLLMQMGSYCEPLAGKNRQRDKKLLEFMDQKENSKAFAGFSDKCSSQYVFRALPLEQLL